MQIRHVDSVPAELRQMLGIARTLQRMLDARIRSDAADGGHDQRQPVVVERAERNFDHHLAAVAPFGDQVHLRSHRALAWVRGIALAVCSMARASRVGHQRVDRHAHQFICGVAEQLLGGRVGQHDHAALVDHQQRIGIGGEQRAEHGAIVEAGNDRLARCFHADTTAGTKR